jgi:hypothetical protein
MFYSTRGATQRVEKNTIVCILTFHVKRTSFRVRQAARRAPLFSLRGDVSSRSTEHRTLNERRHRSTSGLQ